MDGGTLPVWKKYHFGVKKRLEIHISNIIYFFLLNMLKDE